MSLILFALGMFIVITLEMHETAEPPLMDSRLLLWAAQHRTSFLNQIFLSITALGSGTLIFLFTVIGGVLFLLSKDVWCALHLVMASAGGGLCSKVLKHFFARERPFIVPPLVVETSFSYPSGHSLVAASFYLALALAACHHFPSWKARAVILTLALFIVGAVGFSRIYLGVHYPSDVASGIFLGMAWALCLTGILYLKTGPQGLKR